MTLGGTRLVDHFDTKANGLNLLRLLLAVHVIVWHSYAVLGRDFGGSVWRPLVGSAGVDGFFALSGFLILMSWNRDPHPRRYIAARILRILPAFYVLLLLTVLVFAPLAVFIQDGSPSALLTEPSSYSYIWKNVFLWIFDPGVAGTPTDIPYSGSWNASLWTLSWEFACYLGVLALGVAKLANRRWVIAAIFALSTLASIVVAYGPAQSYNVESAVRFATMFSAGMVMCAFRDVVRVHAAIAAAAVVAIAVSVKLDDYRILAALPFAYLLLVVGGALRHSAFRFRTDVSYGVYIYAFPVQQLLVVAGVDVPVVLFALIALACTLPLAWLSWTVVEKPALRMKRRFDTRPRVTTGT
jgi:peptidoglycan/LPS O-acetylase OafA/YrhL